jgi:hypothetical protein
LGKKRSEILAELANGKQALISSEKRGRKAVQRLRELEKIFVPMKDRLQTWAESPLADEANAAKVLSVGDCRKLLRLLFPDAEEGE